MLTLPIKKKWFDMILSGEKLEEYREIKPYYDSRFHNAVGPAYNYLGTTYVIFKNGYLKKSPIIKCKVNIRKGYGKPEWGSRT